MQSISRSYQEGIIGDMDDDPRQTQKALLAWQYQLEKLWNETED